SEAMQAPRQRQGLATEARVERWLAAHGLIPIDRNVRCRLGEIDLVMRDHEHWVFVEVRERRSARFGGAAASIDWRKQQRLVRTAQVYLQRRFGARAWPPCRFDVVAVEEGRPRWIRAAFDLS
ncbi:MAG: YraN family protein, partial [Burkholderiales bacterium]